MHVIEEAVHVGLEGCGHPPVLLREIGVVCNFISELLLLQSHRLQPGTKISDPPGDGFS